MTPITEKFYLVLTPIAGMFEDLFDVVMFDRQQSLRNCDLLINGTYSKDECAELIEQLQQKYQDSLEIICKL